MHTDQLMPVLWRRRWSFLVTFVLVLGTVALVTFQLPKTYVSSSYLLVSPRQPSTSSFEATQISETLTRTYGRLLQTQRTAEQVQGVLGPSVADGDVGGRVDIEAGESQVIEIIAEGRTPREAQIIANTYAGVFTEGAERFSNVDAAAGVVFVAQTGTLPENPSKPRPKLYLAIGALLALLAGAGMALLRQRLDQRLAIADTDTEVLGLPVIGRIPEGQVKMDWVIDGSQGHRSSVRAAEAFRLLLVNLSFANMGERPGSLAIVSASEREGKSTCALSLGRAAAETGLKTLAVDADLRRPSLSEKVQLEHTTVAGLSNLLVDRTSTVSGAAVELPAAGLHVLSSGPVPPNPAALLAGGRLSELDTRARRIFDLVLYDTPPLSIAADASLVATQCDGVVLVIDAQKTRRKSAVHAIDQLRRARVNLLGIVLNRVSGGPESSYYYSGSVEQDTSRSDSGRWLTPTSS